MIYYTINAAKKSGCFDKIFINSDHKIFSKISKKYKVNFYKRIKSLGGSNIKSDSIVYDFMKNNPEADIVVWVNPIAPFQTAKEIKKIVNFFSKKKIDSLITVENKKIHCNYNGKPLNYIKNSKFAKTQDLKMIQTFVYSLMTKSFRIEWFASKEDFTRHMIGAILIGIGGVLSLGCTIGQGVTGVSTLAIGSFITLISIILGAAIAMKVEYYNAVYEDCSFFDSLRSSLADLNLIPNKFRTLEKI